MIPNSGWVVQLAGRARSTERKSQPRYQPSAGNPRPMKDDQAKWTHPKGL